MDNMRRLNEAEIKEAITDEPQTAPEPLYPLRSEVYQDGDSSKVVRRDRAQNAGLAFFQFRGAVYDIDMHLICNQEDIREDEKSPGVMQDTGEKG